MYSKPNHLIFIVLAFTLGLLATAFFIKTPEAGQKTIALATLRQAQDSSALVDTMQEEEVVSAQEDKLTSDRVQGEHQSQPSANAIPPGEMIQYSREAVVLVILVLVLLSLLFYLLLSWSRTRDMASYYGEVYKETVENWEYRQILAPYKEKWDRGEYYEEAVRNKSEPRPEPDQKLLQLAEELGYQSKIEIIRIRSWKVSRGGPGLGSSMPPGIFRDDPWADANSERKADTALSQGEKVDKINEFYNLLSQWEKDIKAWEDEIKKYVNAAYSKDLEHVAKKAGVRAKRATGEMDLSALRGRGAEFVLEFTAVVVIIFSAVILGILGILKEQHIGTLLAAIAGYVLGKATSERRSGGSEERGREVPSGNGATQQRVDNDSGSE